MATIKSPLSVERHFFEQNYDHFLLTHLGEVVLIKGQNILGFFRSKQKAEEEAYKKLGFDTSFLIRHIVKPEEEKKEEVYQRLNLSELE